MFGRWLALLGACLALLIGCAGGYSLNHAPLAGVKRSFDQALVDASAQRLYLADETTPSIDVYDLSQGGARFSNAVRTPAAPKGLAVASDLHEVFASLANGSVAAIDSDPRSKRFGSLLATFSSGAGAADLLDYDPQHHHLYVADPSGKLLIVDALQRRGVASLNLAAGLEQPRWDSATKRVYVNDSDRNSVYAIDPAGPKVTGEWKLPTACAPTGMGLDVKNDRALLGCQSGGQALLWDVQKGKLVSAISGVSGADQVVYDSTSGRYFVAGVLGGAHHGVAIVGGSPAKLQNSVTTYADTAAVAYDDRNQTVYQPDEHPGEQGVLWFALPQPEQPPPGWLAPLAYLVILLAVFAVIMVVGRRRAAARERAGRPLFS